LNYQIFAVLGVNKMGGTVIHVPQKIGHQVFYGTLPTQTR
jgi:hypothetical protein